ncbi:hypothetical protein Mgra_00010042 [Meloidogyne graminicola]|uniref:Uncharacterized protein n=1 Tax=Meloidogyne graminicola TaxID=189291 RepID=A0A8S9ZCT2_9BILA|nr:hypothetical protein Mgra_00010042 [Meloidogyne graminicola]
MFSKCAFSDLTANLDHRPSANAIKYISCVKSFEMNAYQENQKSQSILKMTDSTRSWLKMEIETNPLNKDFDQLVELRIAPIMLMYHAPAVNKALDVFKPPETVRLQQLTAIAIARYEEVKARSTTALQHMVEQKKIKIGNSNRSCYYCPFVLVEFLMKEKTTLITDQKLKKLMAGAYDNFSIKSINVQLIFADNFRTCMKAKV